MEGSGNGSSLIKLNWSPFLDTDYVRSLSLVSSEYGYGIGHPVYLSMGMVWNILYTSECGYMEHLYTSEYGYDMEHPVYIGLWLWYGTPCIHQYGYGMEHPVYIRVWLYGTLCIHRSMVMIWNTLYKSECGYGMEHSVYISMVLVWNILYTSEYGYMEHPVYIRVWL